MVRYADPSRCPDCLAPLPASGHACAGCSLALSGPLASDLFATLQTADRLLERLRAGEGAAPAASYATPATPRPAARTGLSAASVPKILLGLGALCLLVAAVTFLAVAWSWLGVGGRTAVLLGLTAISGALGITLGRRGLRFASEAMTVVALGLLLLDVLGADSAGWLDGLGLGALSAAELAAVSGAIVGGIGLLTSWLGRRDARWETLVAPQVFAVAGLWFVPAGIAGETESETVVFAAAAAAFLALAAVCRNRRIGILPVLFAGAAASWWLPLVTAGVVRAAEHATVAELVGGGDAWPLTAATLQLVLAAVLVRAHRIASAAGLGAAGILGTLTAISASFDNDGVDSSMALLAALVVWAGCCQVTPRARILAAQLPLVAVSLGVFTLATGLMTAALEALLGTGDRWSRSWAVPVAPIDVLHDGATPAAMTLPLTLGVLLAVLAPGGSMRERRFPSRQGAGPAVATLIMSGAATAASYQLPLALVLMLMVAATAVLAAWADRRADLTGVVGMTGVGVLAAGVVVLSLPSVVLTACVTATVVLAAGVSVLRGSRLSVRVVAAGVFPAAVSGLGWSLAEIGGAPEVWRAAPILLVLGLLGIAFAHPPVEVSAAVAAIVAAVASIAAAVDGATALALHLTLGGVLVTTSSLVNPDRRLLGWVGAGLLAAATWVRLWDVGVTAPEAYTLPSALALVLVGLRHLAQNPGSGTAGTLGSGLALATVPSLLRVLVEDPVSVRAALLGLACLVLVLGGTRLLWNAPLLVGVGVGTVLVLRECGPYAADLPPWVLIAAAGAVLLSVGVSWEGRLRDLQDGAAFLARLR